MKAGMKEMPTRKTNKLRFNKTTVILFLMIAPAVILYTLFHYLPLPGVAIAFTKFNISGFQEWVGFDNFKFIFNLNNFWRAFLNNWKYIFLNYVFIFPASIILALLFNELRLMWFKKTIQTISILPHFVSWAVIGGIWMLLLSPSSGYINNVIKMFGGDPIYFFGNVRWFPFLYTFIAVWKGVGYGSIIYLAALSGINGELYEAAAIDGAGRWKQAVHITMPCLKPTILIMFVLSFASVLNLFEPLYVLSNPLVQESAMVLDTYIYETGILKGRYDIATAMGLFKSTISLALVLLSNYLSTKLTEDGESIL